MIHTHHHVCRHSWILRKHNVDSQDSYLNASDTDTHIVLEFWVDWHRLNIVGVLNVVVIAVGDSDTTQAYVQMTPQT